MTVILDLRCSIYTLLMSTSSIIIWPSIISTMRLKERQIVLLPAPVRPTTPILSPASARKVRSFKTSSVLGRYLRKTFLNSIAPYVGQSGCLYLKAGRDMKPSMFSYGIRRRPMQRSALTILDSICIIMRIDEMTNCCSTIEQESSKASMIGLAVWRKNTQKAAIATIVQIESISTRIANQRGTAFYHCVATIFLFNSVQKCYINCCYLLKALIVLLPLMTSERQLSRGLLVTLSILAVSFVAAIDYL